MATEKRLIDANDAISKLEDELHMCKPVSMDDGYLEAYKKIVIPKLLRNVIDWLKTQPTVDAVEVVRGRWIEHPNVEILDGKWISNYECSQCLCWYRTHENYCGYCGAKMDGDGNG